VAEDGRYYSKKCHVYVYTREQASLLSPRPSHLVPLKNKKYDQ
jgi:hypothetical protein